MKWYGKPRRLEIAYDDVEEVWRGFISVKVERPPVRGGSKLLHIDLGVVNLATVWARELKQPIAFSGRAILSDWWYWMKRIAKEQSKMARINKTETSRRLRKLYRIRQRRFRHAMNAMVKTIVEDAHELGISKIVLGKLKGIRNNGCNSKANAMIHNFWSFEYIIRRFKEKAEEYGIEIELVSEYETSSLCPICKTKGIRRYRGLFYCPNCDKAINADVVGVLNMAKGKTIIPSPSWRDRDNGLVAQPLLLRWNGIMWGPKMAMSIRPMKTLEARISRLQSWRVSIRG